VHIFSLWQLMQSGSNQNKKEWSDWPKYNLLPCDWLEIFNRSFLIKLSKYGLKVPESISEL
jgi:hypothetical protein